MKKPLVFLALFLIFSTFLFCYELTLVSKIESIYLAQNWITYINKIPLEGMLGEYQIKFIEQVNHNGYPLCEIYHLYPRGHILIPSYKEFPPIKSFSVVSDFDSKSKGYEWAVLEELKAGFDFLQSYNIGESEEIERSVRRYFVQWNKFVRMDLNRSSLRELDTTAKKSSTDRRNFILKDTFGVKLEAVTAPPLLETEWSQSSPYWNWCPLLGGETSYVGCVATAMAQIMRYYKWPKNGEGSHSYYWSDGGKWLNADFNDSYDWDYMPNETWQYNTYREQNAVAELCYEAGVSVNMSYGIEGSSAYVYRVDDALRTYFKYSNDVRTVYRYYYDNVDEWFDVLKTQRDLSRPVEFAMYSADSGHAVVIDGYLITSGINQVHINMGWSGSYDAYYTLDSILDYTDTFWQHAVIDIIPKSAQVQYTLMITSGIGGTTEPEPGTHTYDEGKQVTITAIPNNNYRFGEWGGDASGTTNPITITMDSNKSITASFIRQYKLTLTSGIGGTTNPTPGQHIYDENTKVTIKAIPNTHYLFNGWSGDVPSGKQNDNPTSITMNSDKSLTADFLRIIYSPSNFAGEKVLNYSFSQDEYLNALTWEANPNNENIEKYRLYQIEGGSKSLLVELDANTFKYWHRNVEKEKQYIYSLVAVNDENREGEPATITVK